MEEVKKFWVYFCNFRIVKNSLIEDIYEWREECEGVSYFEIWGKSILGGGEVGVEFLIWEFD